MIKVLPLLFSKVLSIHRVQESGVTEGTSHFENDNVEGKCPSELGYIVGWVGGRVQGGTTIYVLRSCFPEQDILDKGSHGAIERGETPKDCLILIRQNTLAFFGWRQTRLESNFASH